MELIPVFWIISRTSRISKKSAENRLKIRKKECSCELYCETRSDKVGRISNALSLKIPRYDSKEFTYREIQSTSYVRRLLALLFNGFTLYRHCSRANVSTLVQN